MLLLLVLIFFYWNYCFNVVRWWGWFEVRCILVGLLGRSSFGGKWRWLGLLGGVFWRRRVCCLGLLGFFFYEKGIEVWECDKLLGEDKSDSDMWWFIIGDDVVKISWSLDVIIIFFFLLFLLFMIIIFLLLFMIVLRR